MCGGRRGVDIGARSEAAIARESAMASRAQRTCFTAVTSARRAWCTNCSMKRIKQTFKQTTYRSSRYSVGNVLHRHAGHLAKSAAIGA